MAQIGKACPVQVASIASLAIGAALSEWQFTHVVRFPFYFALAVLTSTVKVGLPQIRGRFCSGSLFMILAVAGLDRAEAMLVAIASGAAAALVNTRERPTVAQLIFNIAAFTIGTSAATAARTMAGMAGADPLPALWCAAIVFHCVHTLVLASGHADDLAPRWGAWLRWTTPAFLVGAIAALTVFAADPWFVWRPVLLVIPAAIALQLGYGRLACRLPSAC